jgi:hypothetical protein
MLIIIIIMKMKTYPANFFQHTTRPIPFIVVILAGGNPSVCKAPALSTEIQYVAINSNNKVM